MVLFFFGNISFELTDFGFDIGQKETGERGMKLLGYMVPLKW